MTNKLSTLTETHIGFPLLNDIAKAPTQWKGTVFTQFDDGDIMDYIDLVNLENHHDCTQDEPEWSLAWGGSYQCQKKTDFIGLGLNRTTKGLTFELANDIDGVLTKSELKKNFVWYITLNTKNNETVIHYSDESFETATRLAGMTWQTIRQWITNNQFLLYIKEYRQKQVPIWFEQQEQHSIDAR